MHTTNEIQKELQKIAPVLASIEKTECYRVPEGYFDELSAGVKRQTTALPPPNSDGYSVPKTYFSSFNKKLNDRINAEKPTNNTSSLPSNRNIISLLRPLTAIAAVVLILIMAAWGITQLSQTHRASHSAAFTEFLDEVGVFDADERAMLAGDVRALLLNNEFMDDIASPDSDELDDILLDLWDENI